MNDNPPPMMPPGEPRRVPAKGKAGRFWQAFWLTFLVASLAYAWYSFYAPSGGVAWASDFATAERQAAESDRPIILFFTAKWCSPCRIMKREVWADDQVMAAVKDRFIPVAIDVDDPGAAATLARYGVGATPTTIITDSKGNVLQGRQGRIGKTDFLEMLGELDAVDAGLRIRYTSGIRAIFEDSRGRFWFGSHQEGVCLFDGGEFTYYTVDDGLSGNQVRTIQEDQAGVIWFGTDHGITSFDGDGFEIRAGRNQGSTEVSFGKTWRKEAGDLWFLGDSGKHSAGSDGQGVYRYDGRTLEYLAFPLPQGAGSENSYRVTGIVKGRDGTVWFGTYPGVFGYDGRSFTLINEETAGFGSGTERFHVRSIFEDSRGDLWIGNNGLGVLRYDGRTVSNFTEQHGLGIRDKGPSGSLGRVFSIAEDASGNIWFGTRDNGAWRFDGESLTNFTTADGLTSPMVWTIYRDKRDALWFGMGDGGVCRFNGESFDRIY